MLYAKVCLLVLFLISSVKFATAQIRVDIPEPRGAGLPIAVSPLASLDSGRGEKPGDEFAEVVARDLDISGYFKVLDQDAYIEGPAGLTLEEINFQNWSVIGALALIKGAFSVNGSSLTVEARLFDVVQRKQLGGRRYRGSVNDLRRMAHRFADQVLYYLTGEQGPFDSRIAFISTRGGRTKEVYVTDLTGDEVTQVTKNRTINLSPAWGPGARSLFFSSYREGGPYVYRIDFFSRAESRLLAVNGFGGKWSPDGSTIAISLEQVGNSDVFLLSPEGQIRQRLTDHPDIDVSPTWSPDGREIAFCSGRSGSPQIYVVNVNSGRLRRLTFSGNYNTSPAWSPKGNQLAYTGRARYAAYSAAKGGLLTFTRALAQELAPAIQVNAVAPGLVDTGFDPLPESRKREIALSLPLKRLGRPDDVAPVFVFLASDEARYFCGQTLGPNGGEVMP